MEIAAEEGFAWIVVKRNPSWIVGQRHRGVWLIPGSEEEFDDNEVVVGPAVRAERSHLETVDSRRG
jgi:hypothetical protein